MKTKENIFPPDINPDKWQSYTTQKRVNILRKWFMENDMPKCYNMITKEDVFDLLNDLRENEK